MTKWLFSYFTKKPALSSIKARLSPKKEHAIELHKERLFSFVETVRLLLSTYVTDETIARAVKEFKSYKQALGVPAALHAKRLYINAVRGGSTMEKTFQVAIRRKFGQVGVRLYACVSGTSSTRTDHGGGKACQNAHQDC